MLRSGWLSRYSDSLRTGASGDRILEGQDFPQPSRPVLIPTQSTIPWVLGHFPGVSERGDDHRPRYSAEDKERFEL